MAIDAEDVLVCIWRFIRFFINTSYTCVQKHPFFSGFLLLFFLVYMFFNLLVYHSPFLICIAILLRFFWSSERPATENVKEKEKETEKEREKTNQITPLTHSIKEDYVVVNRDSQSFSSIRRQKSRRTIHKRNHEWKGQPAKEENDMSFSLTIDQNPKLVVKERASFSFEHRENSTANNIQVGSETSKPETPLASDDSGQKLKKSDSYGVVSEAEIIEESEDEEEEEEAIDNGNKAVEWTEDDQKNLMDLGLSEIERNRRLESLIAKRRARNLFKVQVEKGLVDLNSVVPCPIAPVFVSRNNPFEVPNGTNEIESLQVPGSAPSILLPNKNPFDLPYDPLEEKPNLMADSFQQEFSAVNQKEMLFCRHESFSLGPLQFDHDQHERRDSKSNAFFGSEKRGLEGFGNPRFKRQSGLRQNFCFFLFLSGFLLGIFVRFSFNVALQLLYY